MTTGASRSIARGAAATASSSPSTRRSSSASRTAAGKRLPPSRSILPSMRSGPESFDAVDVQALVSAQQAEMAGLYDGEADIGPTREAAMFVEPDGVFIVVRDGERAVACGGIARFDETRAELKRMYVVPDLRGRGLGRRVLVELEAEARRLGYRALVL